MWNNKADHNLNIQADQTDGNIDFYTSDTAGLDKIRVRITSNGNVGIGTNFTPAYKLDVNGGDINVNTPASGYRIDSNYVLRHNGDTRNIFVGIGAGVSNTLGFGNTFTGHVAGNNNTIGYWNTFMGDSAGFSNTEGKKNTYIGNKAGFSNVGVIDSVYGNFNTFTGYKAGYENTRGAANCFYGRKPDLAI